MLTKHTCIEFTLAQPNTTWDPASHGDLPHDLVTALAQGLRVLAFVLGTNDDVQQVQLALVGGRWTTLPQSAVLDVVELKTALYQPPSGPWRRIAIPQTDPDSRLVVQGDLEVDVVLYPADLVKFMHEYMG
jgi:hypothetical protein